MTDCNGDMFISSVIQLDAFKRKCIVLNSAWKSVEAVLKCIKEKSQRKYHYSQATYDCCILINIINYSLDAFSHFHCFITVNTQKTLAFWNTLWIHSQKLQQIKWHLFEEMDERALKTTGSKLVLVEKGGVLNDKCVFSVEKVRLYCNAI